MRKSSHSIFPHSSPPHLLSCAQNKLDAWFPLQIPTDLSTNIVRTQILTFAKVTFHISTTSRIDHRKHGPFTDISLLSPLARS